MENLANRIIEDIEVEFQSAVHIVEFDVIPAQDSQNRSPVVRIDGNLALEAWCVPTVYMHVYSLLMESRRLAGAKSASITVEEIGSLSRILLLLNPDVITIWNMRKELLTSTESLDSLNEDFQLTELVLTRKPKNSEAFMHRRWLLGKLLKSGSNICTQIVESCVRSELRVCTLAASRYPNNYAAWNHREWVHDTFTDYNLQILFDDLSWSKEWVAVNVSDHSGFQFRQYLLAKMVMSDKPQVDTLLNEEKDTIRKLINYYPGHEALWYHYKLVMLLILKIQTQPRDEQCTPAKVPACEMVVGDSSLQLMYRKCKTSLVEEMDYMEKFANSENSWQMELASRYKRWLSHMMQK